MNRNTLPRLIAAGWLLGIAAGAQAITITATDSQLSAAVAGGGVSSGADTGHAGISGIYTGTGSRAGEALVGQTVSLSAGFEVVSGTPSGPLALAVPGQWDGVTLWGGAELQGLTGGGPPCDNPCTGEGAVSFLFAAPQLAIGLDIIKFENNNALTLQFFTPAGIAFDTLTISPGLSQSWTFTAQSGYVIGGVTITNVDESGVAYDNLRLSPSRSTSVPEPGTLGLLAIGIAGLGLQRRRRLD